VAESVEVAANGARAKIRNPCGVLGLTLITDRPAVRVGVEDRAAHGRDSADGWRFGRQRPLFLVLHVIPIVDLFAPVYMQMELNNAWRAIGERDMTQGSMARGSEEVQAG
jgi:hypothetical protein